VEIKAASRHNNTDFPNALGKQKEEEKKALGSNTGLVGRERCWSEGADSGEVRIGWQRLELAMVVVAVMGQEGDE
jgi:hypothetical protein